MTTQLKRLGDVLLGDQKIKLGSAPDYEIYHNNTTNVNHISSLLSRQLSINSNIINLTNEANNSTYLLLNSSGATFVGAVSTGGYLTLNSSDNIPRLIFNGSGDDFFLSNTATYFGLYNDTDGRWDIKVFGDGSTTFAGDVSVEDNLYLTDAGTTRGKIQLNASDRDDVDIKTVSLGSNMKFFTVDAERMRISSSGDVGINLTSPSAKLDIEGGTALLMTRTSSGLAMYNEVDSGYSKLYLYQTGGSAKVILNTNGASYFNGGNVGIGTSSPDASLEVSKGSEVEII